MENSFDPFSYGRVSVCIMAINHKKKFYLEAQYTVEMAFLFPLIFFLLFLLLYFNFYLHDRLCLLAVADQAAEGVITEESYQKKLWMAEVTEFSADRKGLNTIVTVQASLSFLYPKGSFETKFKVKKNKLSQAQKARMITLGLDIAEKIDNEKK